MIWQCILQVTLLVLNADEVTRTFAQQRPEWCRNNRILSTSASLFMMYNLLAILAVEDHTIVFLKRELSPKVAMLGTLTAGITSSGVLFWAGAVSSPALCASYITSSFASTLMILVLVLLAFRMCTQVDTRKPSTNETSLLFSLISKNKKAVFLTAFVALVCSTLALFQFLGTVVTCVYAPQRYADFPHGVGFIQKIFFLNIIWFVVGIGLPVIFRQLIDLSFNAKEISDDNHLHNMKMPILA